MANRAVVCMHVVKPMYVRNLLAPFLLKIRIELLSNAVYALARNYIAYASDA